MAVVDLTDLRIAGHVPQPFNGAAVQQPTYGSGFRIDRPGSRWQFQFRTPAMHLEPDWRRMVARFDDAERLGGLFEIPQPRFTVGAPGAPVIDGALASGRSVPISGLTPNYAIRAGQWVSVIADGQRFADRIAEQVIASSGGTAEIRLRNLIRVPLAGGETVELGKPKVEGIVEVSEWPEQTPQGISDLAWTVTEVR